MLIRCIETLDWIHQYQYLFTTLQLVAIESWTYSENKYQMILANIDIYLYPYLYTADDKIQYMCPNSINFIRKEKKIYPQLLFLRYD